jgi:predicted mannosyl-3-phosphoglycerate phosphatase (HAD superfamily)
MTATYEKIATTTLGSASNNVTFSSVPATYTDIVVICNAKTDTGSADLWFNFNSDTGSNYSITFISGNGSIIQSARNTNATKMSVTNYGYLETTIGTYIVNIQNYSNTTTYKSSLARANTTSNGLAEGVGLWRSTAAISTIKISPSAENFATGSTFTLYGIKAE